MSEAVNHPALETFHEPPTYYNRGGFHCFEVMDALGLFTKHYIASAFTYSCGNLL